jgi:hypothetical protein
MPSFRSVALFAVGTVLVGGCSAAPGSPTTGTASAELSENCSSDAQCGGSTPYCCEAEGLCVAVVTPACVSLPPPSPLTECTAIPPSESSPYVPDGFALVGNSPASASCDYDVMQITGTYGHPLRMTILDVAPGNNDPPTGVVDAASCSGSYATYEVMGFVPPAGGADGYWAEIVSNTIPGTWRGTRCALLPLEGAGLPIPLPLVPFPYATVRVASRAILQTPQGAIWTPIYVTGGQ